MERIVKIIISFFLLFISVMLIIIWLVLGTMYLTIMIIRLIVLYTISLTNSFISGTTPKTDYNKAIEDVVNNYVFIYIKMLELPKRPWFENQNQVSSESLKEALSQELLEIKKSWFITTFIFISLLLSIGLSVGFLIYINNKELIENYLNNY